MIRRALVPALHIGGRRAGGPVPGADWTEIALVNPGFETGVFEYPWGIDQGISNGIKTTTPFSGPNSGTYYYYSENRNAVIWQDVNLDDHLPPEALLEGVSLQFKATAAFITNSSDSIHFEGVYFRASDGLAVEFNTTPEWVIGPDGVTPVNNVWHTHEGVAMNGWPTSPASRANNILRLRVDQSGGSVVRVGYDDFKLWWRYTP